MLDAPRVPEPRRGDGDSLDAAVEELLDDVDAEMFDLVAGGYLHVGYCDIRKQFIFWATDKGVQELGMIPLSER